MVSPGRTRLILLYGGQSAEHEISCISALHVLRAADPARYDVRLVGITTSGAWVEATDAVAALEPGAKTLPQPVLLTSTPLAVGSGREVGTSLVSAIAGGEDGAPVVVFPVLHGPKGEDGTVQGLLEMAGVAYVGAGVTGSATAMDKGIAKALFAAAGIPQARYLALRAADVDELLAKTVEAELGWPVFVKPANLGSTIGISRAANGDELRAAVELALAYDEFVVIEEALQPREIEVGVLGDADLRVSVPGEILPSRDFYDFEDKYLAGTARWQIPADLPADIAAQIPDLARAACRALRVEGMARVDFFYEEESGRLLVNEINTIPGFTPISMYPQMWAASGVSYPELIDELVAAALARHERRSHFLTSRPGA
jgi:D-alanine-D-alanine ligase